MSAPQTPSTTSAVAADADDRRDQYNPVSQLTWAQWVANQDATVLAQHNATLWQRNWAQWEADQASSVAADAAAAAAEPHLWQEVAFPSGTRWIRIDRLGAMAPFPSANVAEVADFPEWVQVDDLAEWVQVE